AAGNKGAGKNDVCLDYDNTNKVYKCMTVAGWLNPPAEAGSDKTVATITAFGWHRGQQILSAKSGVNLQQFAGADKKYFAFTDKDAFTTCKASAPTVAKLQAPLYVSPTGAAGNTGSQDSPYDSIATALGHFNDPEEDCVINIDGEVKGTNAFGTEDPTTTLHCSKLVLQGANGLYAENTTVDGKVIAKGTPKDALNGNKAGSVLKIGSSVPIVIRNLRIFGGKGTPQSSTTAGGGILMMASTCDLTLDSGTLIGDVINPSAAPTSETDCGNSATSGGGVVVSGTLTIKSGAVIAHNYAWLEEGAGKISRGGAIHVGSQGKLFIEDGAKIIGNACGQNGGAVYSEGQVTMTGGEISQNKADSNGGAVYNSGTFEMSGKAWIPWGADKNNDVYLSSGKYITIASALSLPSGITSGANATITPQGWTRGFVVAQGKDGAELQTSLSSRLYLAGVGGDGWTLELSGDNKKASTFANIFVASTIESGDGAHRYCGAVGSDSNIGTKSAPYATLTKALGDLKDASKDRIIYIDGKITDNVTMELNATDHAKSLTLIGAKITEPQDNLDGGGAGRTLNIKSGGDKGSVPVTIRYLKISGGKAADAGAGIYV
ncbi:MAG: hypothetical protein J5700_03605, partial [Treponema sp.]|nr:hypothetical protein [Treponema sp.]